MNYALSAEQEQIREATARLCDRCDDAYWLERDRSAGFAEAFYRAVADAGRLGIAMPAAFGGSGLGVSEAAVMMQAIAESGAAMSSASAVHMNMFGLNPVVVFGSEVQKAQVLPPLIRGEHKARFAVTGPDAGLDTARINTRAERDAGGYLLSQQTLDIDRAGRGADADPRPKSY